MKWTPLLILAAIIFSLFYFHAFDYLTLNEFRHYQAEATVWTKDHYFLAVLIYISLFVLLIACTIPVATILSLLGGFLFGGIATVYAVFSTTVGGALLFLAVRTALGIKITKRSAKWLRIMEAGFKKDAFNYLLVLRLIPVLPCWISNISAGVLNVRLFTFIAATCIGVTPSTFIYVMAGRSLDKIIISDQQSIGNLLLTPEVLLPLLGLAFLSLFPVIYKKLKKPSDS